MRKNKTNITAIIPARGSQQSIPNKNILPLGDHPLIAYSIATSRQSSYISEAVVTTDSQHIANIAKQYGANTPFLRPKEISGPNALDIEFFRHYLDFLSRNNSSIPELIVHLRPTTPLRNVEIIDAAIEYMINHPEATALRSAYETHLTPYKMFKLNGEYMQPFLSSDKAKEFYNLPRQIFEKAYIPNGYVDIIRPRILMETDMLHGESMKMWETPNVPDIDTLEDLEFAKHELNMNSFKTLLDFLEREAA